MQREYNNAQKQNVIFAFQLSSIFLFFFFFQRNAPGTVLAGILDEAAAGKAGERRQLLEIRVQPKPPVCLCSWRIPPGNFPLKRSLPAEFSPWYCLPCENGGC